MLNGSFVVSTRRVSAHVVVEPLEGRRMLAGTLDLYWASFDRELIHHDGQPTGVPQYGIKPWEAGLCINGEGITSATLTRPSGPALTMELEGNGDWSATQWFDTREQMLAAFPDGQYTLTLNGGADSVVLNYAAGAEPGGIAQITSPSPDATGVPTTSPQFTWSSAVGLGDKLDAYILDGANFGQVYYLENAPITQTQWTYPGTLQPSKDYILLIAVIREQRLVRATAHGDSFEYFAPWHSWNNTVKFTTAGAPPTGSVLPVAGTPASGGSSTVVLYDPAANQAALTLTPYAGFGGDVRIAGGDLTGDGTLDLIAGTGAGAAHVKVLDGVTGQPIAGPLGSFLIYPGPGNTPEDPNSDYYRLAFKGGTFVAAGDYNNDGRDDLITAADAGAGPHVKVFSGTDGSTLASFFAFDPGFSGGVRVAMGDIDADGTGDIIVGAGPGAGPHCKVFRGNSGYAPQEIRSFFAFNGGFDSGLYVAGGDTDGDGRAEIIIGAGDTATPHVKAFRSPDNAHNTEVASFFAFTPGSSAGVRVAMGDTDEDGRAELIAGSGRGGATVRVFDLIDGYNPPTLADFVAYDGAGGGVWVAGCT